MSSPIVIATAVESGLGFFLTSFISFFKEYSNAAHFMSIAIGSAVLLTVKSRIERAVEGYFAHKTLEF